MPFWQQLNAQEKRYIAYGLIMALGLFGVLEIYRPLKTWQAQQREIARLQLRIDKMQQKLLELEQQRSASMANEPSVQQSQPGAQKGIKEKVEYLLTSRWPQLQIQWLQYIAHEEREKTAAFHLQIHGDYPYLRRYLDVLQDQAGIRFKTMNIRSADKAKNPKPSGGMVMFLSVDPNTL